MTIQDSLQHPWIKVGLTSAFGFCCPSFSSFNILSRFVSYNQPKDTQQALSRKESAVNMEKFKKFAARRKWKVRVFHLTGFYAHAEASGAIKYISHDAL